MKRFMKNIWDTAEILRPMIANTAVMADEALKAGKKLMFEGAQGMLLDIDLGTYPYVTSSHPSRRGVPRE